MAATSTKFRVIIVGGGPIGLTAAHILSKIGIDFVVLEGRPTIAPDQGSGIVIAQHTLRIYDQLDILDAIAAKNHPIHIKKIVDHAGRQYNTNYIFQWAEAAHGHPTFVLYRPDLVDVLYDQLSDEAKAKILTNKKVSEVELTEHGVTAHCADGSAIHGSIVLGADGVHSLVRKEMRRLALQQDGPNATVNPERPHLITYRCLYGSLPLLPGLEPGVVWGSHGSGRSSQLFVGRDKAAFLAYEELPQPKRESARYTEQDEKEFVAGRIGDILVTDKYTLRDVYGASVSSGLLDLQEGCMDVLAWERLVLVGDAANKQTPNLGQGYNNGVQDLVAIATGLQKLLEDYGPAVPDNSEIGIQSIGTVMAEYQAARWPESKNINGKSAKATRIQAWQTWYFWLAERYIMPFLRLDKLLFRLLACHAISNGRVLPTLEEKALKWGTVPWVNLPPAWTKKNL